MSTLRTCRQCRSAGKAADHARVRRDAPSSGRTPAAASGGDTPRCAPGCAASCGDGDFGCGGACGGSSARRGCTSRWPRSASSRTARSPPIPPPARSAACRRSARPVQRAAIDAAVQFAVLVMRLPTVAAPAGLQVAGVVPVAPAISRLGGRCRSAASRLRSRAAGTVRAWRLSRCLRPAQAASAQRKRGRQSPPDCLAIRPGAAQCHRSLPAVPSPDPPSRPRVPAASMLHRRDHSAAVPEQTQTASVAAASGVASLRQERNGIGSIGALIHARYRLSAEFAGFGPYATGLSQLQLSGLSKSPAHAYSPQQPRQAEQRARRRASARRPWRQSSTHRRDQRVELPMPCAASHVPRQLEVFMAPSLRATGVASRSGDCAIGMPIRSPIAFASRITAEPELARQRIVEIGVGGGAGGRRHRVSSCCPQSLNQTSRLDVGAHASGLEARGRQAPRAVRGQSLMAPPLRLPACLLPAALLLKHLPAHH